MIRTCQRRQVCGAIQSSLPLVFPLLMVDNSAPRADRLTVYVIFRILPAILFVLRTCREITVVVCSSWRTRRIRTRSATGTTRWRDDASPAQYPRACTRKWRSSLWIDSSITRRCYSSGSSETSASRALGGRQRRSSLHQLDRSRNQGPTIMNGRASTRINTKCLACGSTEPHLFDSDDTMSRTASSVRVLRAAGARATIRLEVDP